LGIIISSLTYPIYRFILKILKNRAIFASMITCILVIIVVLVPIFFITFIIAQQAAETYQTITLKLQSGKFDSYLNPENWGFLKEFLQKYAPFVDVEEINIKQEIISLLRTISSFLVNSTAQILTNIGSFISSFFIMIFVLFFFYKDGERFLKTLTHLSPLPTSYETRIYEKFKEISQSIFIGVFFTMIIQGILGGLGFAIVGVVPFLWGILMALTSVIPIVGTALIWVPAGIVLIITGSPGAGVFLMIWSLLLSILVDNVIKPLLIKGKSNMHPLIVFFSILGGIQVFGFFGILLGPLMIGMLLLLIEMYEQKNRNLLNKMDKR
jgi:predicted PurR-regulated permease PerM